MIFRQLFDSVSSTYSYVLASRRGGEALIIDPVLERVDRYLKLTATLCSSAAPGAPTSRTAIPAPNTRACSACSGFRKRRWSFPRTTTKATPSAPSARRSASIRACRFVTPTSTRS
jgi:hypothetical protein